MRVPLLSVLVALLLGIVLAPLAFEQASAQTVGLKEGQWVKYIPSCIVNVSISDNELKMEKKDIMEKYCSEIAEIKFGVTDVNDIEWYKVKVSKVDGTEVTFDESIKVKGSAEKSMGSYGILLESLHLSKPFAIHVGLGIGDQIPIQSISINSPLEVYEISDMSEDVLWKNSGFENVEFLHLVSSTIEDGDENGTELYLDADLWFERSTGILLESVISISIYYDGYKEWVKVSEQLELLDFSSVGMKVQEKIDLDSLSFEEPQQQAQQPQGGGCLIATAAFGSEMAPQVQFLRELRDNTVLQTESGTSFMAGFNQFYYSFSPAIADYERENPVFKEVVKMTLTPLLTSLTLLQYADIDSESEMLGYGIGIILLNIGMYFVAPAVLIMKIRK